MEKWRDSLLVVKQMWIGSGIKYKKVNVRRSV
jgi:hypothetical protein